MCLASYSNDIFCDIFPYALWFCGHMQWRHTVSHENVWFLKIMRCLLLHQLINHDHLNESSASIYSLLMCFVSDPLPKKIRKVPHGLPTSISSVSVDVASLVSEPRLSSHVPSVWPTCTHTCTSCSAHVTYYMHTEDTPPRPWRVNVGRFLCRFLFKSDQFSFFPVKSEGDNIFSRILVMFFLLSDFFIPNPTYAKHAQRAEWEMYVSSSLCIWCISPFLNSFFSQKCSFDPVRLVGYYLFSGKCSIIWDACTIADIKWIFDTIFTEFQT